MRKHHKVVSILMSVLLVLNLNPAFAFASPAESQGTDPVATQVVDTPNGQGGEVVAGEESDDTAPVEPMRGGSSFDVSEETYVAQVGDQQYASLQAAIDAAVAGDTITLLGNVDATDAMYSGDSRYNLWIDKSLTIDGDGQLEVTVKGRGFGVQGASDNIDVTFKDVVINAVGSDGSRCIDTRGKIGSLTLDGVTLSTATSSSTGFLQPLTIGGNQADKATVIIRNSEIVTSSAANTGYAITTFNPVDMTITNGTIKGWACLNIKGADNSAGSAGSTIAIDGSTLESANDTPGNSNAFSLIKIEDDNVSVSIKNADIDINGADNTQSLVSFQKLDQTNATGCSVTLDSGNEIALSGDAQIASSVDETTTVSIGLGNQIIDSTEDGAGFAPYLPADTVLDADGYVVAENYVAQVGETKYSTLAEAVAATQTGTITLLRDASGAGIFVAAADAKDITIDLGGFTYTCTGPAVGSVGSATQAFHLEKGNKVTIKNGKVTSAADSGVMMLVQNYCDLTLDGVTLEGANLPGTGAYVLSTNNGSTVINDTTINAKEGDVAFDVCGGWGGYDSNSVTVTGGSEINGDVEVTWYSEQGGPELTLASGELNGDIVMGEGADKATVAESDAFNAAAPEGYKWVENAQGGYDLVKTQYVTVTFVTEEGIEAPEAQTIEAGTTANKPADPVKDGYSFLGWYAPEATEAFDFENAIAADTTLSATWDAVPPIKYYNTWNPSNAYYFAGEDPIPSRSTQVPTPTIKREGESSYHAAEDWVQISWKVTDSSATSADGPASDIATVDDSGLVTFSAPGTVKVWLTMTDPGGASKSAYKTVSYKSAPAYIERGGEKIAYATLLSAFNAAQDGETIVLGADYTAGNIARMELKDGRDITIDLNGHDVTFDANYGTNTGSLFNIKKGSLTVTSSAEGGAIAATGTGGRVFSLESTADNAADTALTIGEGVSVSSAHECCVALFGKATLNTAGDLSSPEDFAITGNGSAGNGGTVINVTGGTVAGDEVAIYHPQDGALTISGGTITGDTAVYVKSGEVSITGGTLRGTGEAAGYAYNGNGANATGDALVVDSCGYPGGAPTVSVSGGTLTSANAQAVGSYAYGDGNEAVEDIISPAGTAVFSDDDSDGVPAGYLLVEIAEGDNAGMYELAEAVTVTFDSNGGSAVEAQKIQKGTTATEPDDPTMDGYSFLGWYAAGADESFDFTTTISENLTLTAQWGKNVAEINGQDYTSLVAAVRAAQDGETVKVLENTEAGFWAPDVEKAITIDLNGNTVTGWLAIDDGPQVTLANGTLVGTVYVYGSAVDEANHNSFTLASDATIKAADGMGDFAVILEESYGTTGPSSYGSTINLNGTVEGITWVMGNITSDGNNLSVINVNGTLTSSDVAVGLNGNAILNVNNGARITGSTGIEVRSGELNVNGGTITGNGKDGQTEVTVVPNGSGTTTDGAGIAIAQHTTNHAIDVTISGGTISGLEAVHQSDPQNTGSDNVAAVIEGGTFKGAVNANPAETSEATYPLAKYPVEQADGSYAIQYSLESPDIQVFAESNSFTYTGSQITPEVTVKVKGGETSSLVELAYAAAEVVPGAELDADDYTVAYGENLNVGEKAGTITITGTGQFAGTRNATFDITALELASVELSADTAVYNTADQTPTVTVKDAAGNVVDAALYTATWTGSDRINVGESTVTITLPEGSNYSMPAEPLTATFTVTPKDIVDENVAELASVQYTGAAIQPSDIVVNLGDPWGTLSSETDYTLAYGENASVGLGTVTITGTGNYTGTIKKYFTITPGSVSLGHATIEAIADQAYTGSAIEPALTVKVGETTLTPGTDYTVTYANNVNAGDKSASAFIIGEGNYTGGQVVSFTITPADVTVPTATNFTYDGTEKTGVADPAEGAHYTLSGTTKATDAGEYTATATLESTNYKWATEFDGTLTWQIVPAEVTSITIGDIADQIYAGEAIEPAVTVTTVPAGATYDVAYTNNTAAGQATVTVTPSGNYTGAAATANFNIVEAVAEVNGVGYATLKAAVAAAEDGDTVKLLKDTEESFWVPDVKETITIDLGGNTMTGNLLIDDGPKVTVENGTIAGTVYVYGGAADNADYNGFTLAENATIDNDGSYGIILCESYPAGGTTNTAFGTTINLNGTIDGIVWVMGNITADGENLSVINVNGAAITGDDVGIAIQGNAIVNVNEGSEITGVSETGTGIEVRSGQLVVNGGTITGEGEAPVGVEPNGNGTTTSGAGIAIAQHTTKHNIAVTINGGEISGAVALYEANPEGNEGVSEAIDLAVMGGTFTSTDEFGENAVVVADVEKFVYGGNFSNQVPAEYAAEGLVPSTQLPDGTWTVVEPTPVAETGGVQYTSLQAAIDAADDGDTVKLLVDTNENIVIPAEKSIELDLNYNTLTNATGAHTVIVYGGLTGINGNIVSTNNCGICVSGGELYIESGSVEAQEMAVLVLDGGTATIDDGTFTAKDNAVIGTNGTNGRGDNTIEINGGTFNGGIETPGYIACGIYVANDDTVTVNDGEFNITGGAGIVARAGSVEVNGGYFETTGDTVGKVGDSRVVVPCAALVFDTDANYPGMDDDSAISVSGGIFESESDTVATVGEKSRIQIERGQFSDEAGNAAAQVKEGYELAYNDESEYYEVSRIFYTVTFDEAGGTEVEDQIVGYKGLVDEAAAATTKDGALFEAWTLNGQPYDFETPVKGDIELVATWATAVAEIDGVQFASLQAAVDAAKPGDTITMIADEELDAQVVVAKEVTIDFAGHKIYNDTADPDIWAGDSWSLVSVQGADVTITGNGTLESKPNDSFALDVRDGGKLTVEDGTFVGNIHAVYVEKGEAVIEGGDYSVIQKYNAATPDGFVVNLYDANRTAGTAKATITGGTFHGFDPSNNVAEGPNTDFTPVEYYGYETETEGVWTVDQREVVEIPTGLTLTYNGAEQEGVPANIGYGLENYKQTNAGGYTATATLAEGYIWSDVTVEPKDITWTIAKANLADAEIAAIDDQTYTAAAIEPTPAVTFGELTLTSPADYTVAYENNTNVGTATVTLTAADDGNFTGTATQTFKINRATITTATIADQVYTGAALEPTPVVKAGEATVADNAGNYTVTYFENTEVGEGIAFIQGTGNYTGSAIAKFKITESDKTALKAAIDGVEYVAASEDGFDLEPGTTYTTPAAKQPLADAVAAAQAVVDNPNVTAEEVANALTALNDAKAAYEAAQKEAEQAVAMIGDKHFTTLDAATAAAVDGDTIVMVADDDMPTGYAMVTAKVTLDLAGHKVVNMSGGNPAVYVNGGDLTVIDTVGDGRIANPSFAPNNKGNYSGVHVSNGALTVNGGRISGQNGVFAVGSTVTLNDGTIHSTGQRGIYAQNSTVNINDGLVNGVFRGVDLNATSTLNVDGGRIITSGTNNTRRAINVTGGTATINISGGEMTGADFGIQVAAGTADITITGGTVIGGEKAIELASGDSKVAVSGGWFSHKVADEYVADGYWATGEQASAPNTGAKFTVGKIQKVDKPTLVAESFVYDGTEQAGVTYDADTQGYEVEGTAAATEAGSYTFTATLNEGYVWSDDTVEPVTYNWAIQGAVAKIGDVNYPSLQAAVDAAVDGDTITMIADEELDAQVVVKTDVTIDLNGHKLYNDAADPDIWAGDNWSLVSAQGADVTVTGNGSLIAKDNDSYALDVRDGGKLIVENGTFVGNISAVYVYEGEAVIEGGDFSAVQMSEHNDYRFLVNLYDANRTAGTAKATITGGTFKEFDPENNLAEGPDTDFTPVEYFGYEVEPGIWTVDLRTVVEIPEGLTVTYNGKPQVCIPESPYYTLTHNTQTDAEKYAANATLAEGCIWSDGTTYNKIISYEILPADLSTAYIAPIAPQKYDGTEKEPALEVTLGALELATPADYTVEYSNNTAAGIATATITGTGNFTGKAWTQFAINEALDSDLTVEDIADVDYNGSAFTPAVTVKQGETVLAAGTDYDVTYLNNVEPGTATVVINLKGNYEGQLTTTFQIKPVDVTEVAIPTGAQLIYSGAEQTGVVAGENYTLSGVTAATDAGTYTATATLAEGDFIWSDGTTAPKAVAWTIAKADESVWTAVAEDATYDGTAKKTASVKIGETVVDPANYTVVYMGNIEVGTATAIVIGKGNLTGASTVTFEIKPAELNTAALEAAIAAAQAAVAGVTPSEDGTELTPGTKWATPEEINDVLGAAAVGEAKLADLTSATQAEIDDLAGIIQAVADGFTPKTAATDKADLNAAIAAAQADKAATAQSEYGEGVDPNEVYANKAAHDALAEAIATAQAVADKADATQEEVDAAATALQAAQDAFDAAKQAADPDLAELLAAIASATQARANTLIAENAADVAAGEHFATQSQKDDLNDAIVAALIVANNPASTQQQIDDATTALTAALGAFNDAVAEQVGTKQEAAPVTKTALEAAIAAAIADRAATTEAENAADVPAGEHYVTSAQKDALSDAIAAAKAVLNDPTATQEQVDAAAQAVAIAQQAFDDAKADQVGTKTEPAPVTKDALEAAITAALAERDATVITDDPSNLADGTMYTDQTARDNYNNAIAAAQAVANDPEATQAQVDAAKAALDTATEAFEAASKRAGVDDSALVAAIAAAAADENATKVSMDGSDVDPTDQWVPQAAKDTLDAAIATAQAVADNPKATQNDVDAATTALKAAQDAFDAAKQAGAPNKAALASAIAAASEDGAATTIADDAANVEQGEKFATTAAKATLDEAIAAAQQVMDNPNATLAEIAAATEAVKAAQDVFDTAKQDGTKVPVNTIDRIAGDYANETAALIGIQPFEKSEWVIIAREDDFADAMSATGLAGALNAPILLTDRTTLSPATEQAIRDLGATSAYVIGGTGAIAPKIDSDLAALGVTSERVWGEYSYDTSVECAKKIALYSGSTTTAIVAMPSNFQDALSISSYAYKYKVPILLQTFGDTAADRGMTDDAKAILSGRSVIVAGGPGAVSNESLEGLNVTQRIYGDDGYGTSQAIAEYMVANGFLSPETITIACGAQAAHGVDALAGAALAGQAGGPILLVSTNDAMEAVNTTAADSFIAANKDAIKHAHILGGAYVMPDDYYASVMAAISAVETAIKQL